VADVDAFLRRWAARKSQARRAGATSKPADKGAVQPQDSGATGEGEAAPPTSTTPVSVTPSHDETSAIALPDIDSLTAASDFSPFMRPGVPDDLRTRALRRLWKLDPVYAYQDGLTDYAEDYTDAAAVVPGLKSAYQVGRGFLDALTGPGVEPQVSPDAHPPASDPLIADAVPVSQDLAHDASPTIGPAAGFAPAKDPSDAENRG